MFTPDAIDLKLLDLLQKDCRYTMRQLAHIVNLSTTPTYERVRRLEREGYITGYSARLSPQRLRIGFTVYCQIKMKRLDTEVSDEFIALMQSLPEVAECYAVSGAFDFLLRVYAADLESYRDFVLGTLSRIEAIGSVESLFVMNEAKRTSELPTYQLNRE